MCSATQTRPLQHAAGGWRLALVERSARRRAPVKMRLQRRADLRLPDGAQACGPAARRRTAAASAARHRAAPASAATARAPRAAAPAPAARGLPAVRRWGSRRRRRCLPSGRLPCAKKASSASTSASLLRRRQLDVDALDAVGVLAHARQRDHHVLVDLEGVGVLGDRRGALAVEPELLARLGADGDEAFAAARSWRCAPPRGWRAPPRRRRRRRCRRTAPSWAGRRACSWWRSPPPSGSGRPGAPGRPACAPPRFCSANMKSLISTMLGTASLRVAEELQAHRARVRRHAVHDPARAGDQAVAAFLLDAGQAGEELVGDVLAQAFLAEGACRGCPAARCAPASCRRRRSSCSSKLATSASWILPRLWFRRVDLQPLAPRGVTMRQRGQVVQRRAPQHGLLAAGVHGDVAADAARPRPRSGRPRTRSRRARPHRPRAASPRRLRSRRWPPARSRPGSATISTSVMASSFSVLMTALFQVSGIAPPV